MKKLVMGGMVLLASIVLTGCHQSTKEKTSPSSFSLSSSSTLQSSDNHDNVRKDFDKIVVGTAAENFAGGTNLEQLKQYFGEPKSHTQEKPASGDITLEVYTWTFGNVVIETKLYNNSTLVRSIRGYTYDRKETFTAKDYKDLKNGMSYSNMVAKYGAPDSLSEAASSNGVELQAVWTSNLELVKDQEQGRMILTFTDGSLSNKEQSGLGA